MQHIGFSTDTDTEATNT